MDPIVTSDNKHFYFMESSGGMFSTISVAIASLFIYNVLGDLDRDGLIPILRIR